MKKKITILIITIIISCALYLFLGPFMFNNDQDLHYTNNHKYPQNETAALLIHGFGDSPEEMKLLGDYLHKNNIDAHYVLLLGHGTTLQELRKTRWTDWYSSVKEKFDSLNKQYKKIIIIGFSTGANLGILLSLERKADKLILLSPALKFKEQSWLPFKLKDLIKVLRHIVPYVPKIKKGDIKEKKNLDLRGFCYMKYPLDSLYELTLLMDEAMNKAENIDIPCLIIHSRDDKSMDHKGAEKLYNTIKSKKKEIILLNDIGHVIILDKGYMQLYKKITAFIKK